MLAPAVGLTVTETKKLAMANTHTKLQDGN